MSDDKDLVPIGQSTPLLSFGQVQLNAADFVPPRIKVAQQMSAETTTEKDPAKPGDLINTLTGENLGSSMAFVPLQLFKQRIFLVRDERRKLAEQALGTTLPDGNGLMCRSFDMFKGIGYPGQLCEGCPLSKWDDDNRTPPLCTETYNIAACSEFGDLIILSFGKSSAKSGKKLFSALGLSAAAMWSRVWQAQTTKRENNQGTFFVLEAKMTAAPPATEILKIINNRWLPMLTGGKIKLDTDEGLVTEDDEPAEPVEGKF